MLVLSRKANQSIQIGENIKVTIIKTQGNSVRIGIEAPDDVHILRGELAEWHELSFGEEAPPNGETMPWKAAAQLQPDVGLNACWTI